MRNMTRRHGRALRLVFAALALALVTAACGDSAADEKGGSSGQSVSGEIVVSGSSTVEPITSLVAERFQGQNPDVSISVDGPGTGDGFELFCNGETDISDASRPIEPEEQKLCKKGGIEYIELKIGIDGITVLTSPENTAVECLDYKDLYALLGPESTGFENWSDANALGEEIGAAHVPYPNEPLVITAPGPESGTYDSFAELVLEGTAEERGVPEEKWVPRDDYQASPNDNVIIEGIAGSPSSLGWVGFAFYEQNSETVRGVPVAEEGTDCVEPTTETIADGSYPISRDLYFYVNAQKAEDNEALAAFVDFYLSDEGLASVSEVGYVDQPAEKIQATIDTWESRATGTKDG
jgi:phosphate transport system substrate-binding protein